MKPEERVVKVPKPEPVHDTPSVQEVPVENPIRSAVVSPPKLVRQLSVIPERVAITPEIMREHRQQIMRERIQLRQDKMKNLFANSIQ